MVKTPAELNIEHSLKKQAKWLWRISKTKTLESKNRLIDLMFDDETCKNIMWLSRPVPGYEMPKTTQLLRALCEEFAKELRIDLR